MTIKTGRDLKSILAATALLAIFLGAAGRIHLRVESTLIGYELGSLKSEEVRLLESRGKLKMQLAKLTSKKHLQLMANVNSENKNDKSVASK